jgi:hypothetical protein
MTEEYKSKENDKYTQVYNQNKTGVPLYDHVFGGENAS